MASRPHFNGWHFMNERVLLVIKITTTRSIDDRIFILNANWCATIDKTNQLISDQWSVRCQWWPLDRRNRRINRINRFRELITNHFRYGIAFEEPSMARSRLESFHFVMRSMVESHRTHTDSIQFQIISSFASAMLIYYKLQKKYLYFIRNGFSTGLTCKCNISAASTPKQLW